MQLNLAFIQEIMQNEHLPLTTDKSNSSACLCKLCVYLRYVYTIENDKLADEMCTIGNG